MWITDNASDEVRELMFGLVNPVLRFVLTHLFGPPYEKAKQAMWGGTPAFALAPITVEETLA